MKQRMKEQILIIALHTIFQGSQQFKQSILNRICMETMCACMLCIYA